MTGCTECGAPLAYDQKYCTACGARRGGLPARISKLLAPLDMPAPPAIAGVPPIAVAPPAAVSTGPLAALDDWVDNFEIPSPRVMATAALSLLAFGVLLGSLFGNPQFGPAYLFGNPESPALAAAETPVTPTAAATPIAAAAETPVASPTGETPAATPATGATAKVNHVWLIVLSNQSYATSFGDTSSQSYLATDLVSQGTTLQNYYAVAQGELANRSALISGQGPTWQITQNCPRYTPVTPASVDLSSGQILGDGCVYPDTVHTIGDAITATGKTWATYAEDIDNGANGRTTACTTPADGGADPDHAASATNAYTTWSNPFMYFKGTAANCQFQVYGMKQLESDLSAGQSPAFSLVIPNRCHDGSDTPCTPGAPAGLASSDSFLRDVVSKIMGSKDYLDGGLIAITFDQAPQGAAGADVSGCCAQPAFPNLATPPIVDQPAPTGPTAAADPTGETGQTGQTGEGKDPAEPTSTTGVTGALAPVAAPTLPTYVATAPDGSPAGGGKVGLLLLSKMVKAGGTDVTDLNHFSLLLSIENWFGTEKLGYTSEVGMASLPDSLFSAGATAATGE